MPQKRLKIDDGTPVLSQLGDDQRRVVFGLLLCLATLPLALWNEGRDVQRYRARRDGIGSAAEVPASRVNARWEGRLVLVTGVPATRGPLRDPAFDIQAPALKLERIVEMYQWRERLEQQVEQKIGALPTTNNVYLYERVWSTPVIASGGFKSAAEHQNPTHLPYTNGVWTADPIKLGAFVLSTGLVAQIQPTMPVILGTNVCVPAALQDKAKRDPEQIYIGQSQAQPQIGDVRIRFRTAPVIGLSVVARQADQSFAAYRTRRGLRIEALRMGIHTVEGWLAEDNPTEGRVARWFLRAVSFMCLFVGSGLFLGPLAGFARVRKAVGDMEQNGVTLVALACAVTLAAAEMGAVWIWWRPGLGAALLAPSAAAFLLLRYRLQRTEKTGEKTGKKTGA